ncbi:helix-turn-helix transcriptional regulator [Endozoicomonas sp. SM1973]|uniref:Helix-turn-helix transcriptional regulator n=1 Tax=Spartinivicinus marinus TaxID=2994442 RepID=A0A853IG18_9GAMM|nr:helix-turn-helix transcriptional regulator [Spartinivicinus marinus]MCX4029754.1 helix-turn-helix transcriptional regulator [Spartinivicinus marinus]NYZ68085.1 helix-turn-helix transcriptional regulator [Spartinivicinus marinus]
MEAFETYCKGMAAHLRKIRKQRGMTQEALAEAANISPEYVSRIERGINKPSLKTLYDLSMALEFKFILIDEGPEQETNH